MSSVHLSGKVGFDITTADNITRNTLFNNALKVIKHGDRNAMHFLQHISCVIVGLSKMRAKYAEMPTELQTAVLQSVEKYMHLHNEFGVENILRS